ncbi:beta-fructofuranosidase [Anoxybacillus pushchinoensis]|jgi:beta-fructofuranosidase|uniref:Beta-fructofuranosidase n=1 Tax=Anoxybacillus pushchinoensis TaxID=150248 RepID=A0A1I0TUK0_9BACL|nr:beta-fructofuranosidase [Anoxybacillus pushchinoensis]
MTNNGYREMKMAAEGGDITVCSIDAWKLKDIWDER